MARLNGSRAKLDEQIMAAMTRRGEAEKRAWKTEMARDKALKELEDSVEVFNSAAGELLLLPVVARQVSHSSLHVRVESGEEAILVPDMRKSVQPLLVGLSDQCDQMQQQLAAELLATRDALAKAGELAGEKLEDCAEEQRRVATLEQQYSREKEVRVVVAYFSVYVIARPRGTLPPTATAALDSTQQHSKETPPKHSKHSTPSGHSTPPNEFVILRCRCWTRSRASRRQPSRRCRYRAGDGANPGRPRWPARTSSLPRPRRTRPSPSTACDWSAFMPVLSVHVVFLNLRFNSLCRSLCHTLCQTYTLPVALSPSPCPSVDLMQHGHWTTEPLLLACW